MGKPLKDIDVYTNKWKHLHTNKTVFYRENMDI